MDYVDLGESRIRDATSESLLVEIEGNRVWVPRSVFHPDTDVYNRNRGDFIDVVVTEEWAQNTGHSWPGPIVV
jgi:hypothetical protein